jgi:hypothetical protein
MKHLYIENFRAMRANEALCKSVLPRFAKLNVGKRNVSALCPALNGKRDQQTPNVCSDEARTAMLGNEFVKNIL